MLGYVLHPHTHTHTQKPYVFLSLWSRVCACPWLWVPCAPCSMQRANFQATFMLFPTAASGLYVRNEMFRTGPGAGALNDASGGAIAQSFVTSYFQIFDSDRRGLAAIYVRVGMHPLCLPCLFPDFSCGCAARAFACCTAVTSCAYGSVWLLCWLTARCPLQRPGSFLQFEGKLAAGVAPIIEQLGVRTRATAVTCRRVCVCM